MAIFVTKVATYPWHHYHVCGVLTCGNDCFETKSSPFLSPCLLLCQLAEVGFGPRSSHINQLSERPQSRRRRRRREGRELAPTYRTHQALPQSGTKSYETSLKNRKDVSKNLRSHPGRLSHQLLEFPTHRLGTPLGLGSSISLLSSPWEKSCSTVWVCLSVWGFVLRQHLCFLPLSFFRGRCVGEKQKLACVQQIPMEQDAQNHFQCFGQ